MVCHTSPHKPLLSLGMGHSLWSKLGIIGKGKKERQMQGLPPGQIPEGFGSLEVAVVRGESVSNVLQHTSLS